MKKIISCLVAGIALITATLWFTACQKDKSTIEVFAPTSTPLGKSYTDWTIQWMNEFVSYDCANNPFNNPANVLFYQEGPVYFMAGLNTVGASVNVTIPQGKALLFPLLNYLNDYPCPDATFQPAPGQSMEDFLTAGVLDVLNQATGLEVTLDGEKVSDPATYKFVSKLFNFTANPALASCFDACVTGTSQPGVTGGYYMMLNNLSKGTHTVHYHAEITAWNWIQDGTFNITVE
jgi:hypothetical protein